MRVQTFYMSRYVYYSKDDITELWELLSTKARGLLELNGFTSEKDLLSDTHWDLLLVISSSGLITIVANLNLAKHINSLSKFKQNLIENDWYLIKNIICWHPGVMNGVSIS